jgi:hypothetical protein
MSIPLDEIHAKTRSVAILTPRKLGAILEPVVTQGQISLVHSYERRPVSILAHRVLVSVAERGSQGVYLDTGNNFRPSLLRDMIRQEDQLEESLSRIHRAPIFGLDDLVKAVQAVRTLEGVSIVLLDNLTGALNLTASPGYKGRQRMLFNTLEGIRELVNDTGVHFLMTDQTSIRWKTGEAKPIGGNVLIHDVDSIVRIDSLPERSSYVRVLVERCPLNPRETGVVLEMTSKGFRDIGR